MNRTEKTHIKQDYKHLEEKNEHFGINEEGKHDLSFRMHDV